MSTDADYLPLGGHLLPHEYQEFLFNWNKTIANANGSWLGTARQRYKAEHPEQWMQWIAENKLMLEKYLAETDAVKAYQAEHPEEADRGNKRSLYYDHHQWPSPRAKLFVQKLRERHTYHHGTTWSDTFKLLWWAAGNREYKLTHDNCLRYLAYMCKTTVEEFLGRTPIEVNTQLFSENHGVPGFFIKKYGYF